MNILIDIGHPAHVHLLRHIYADLIEHNHKVFVTVKDVISSKGLLDKYNIPYISIGNKKDSLIGKALLQFVYNFRIWLLTVQEKIDIGIGSSITLAHVSRFTKMRSIILDDDDDEVEPLFVKYGHPYADIICSPKGVIRKSKKTLYYDGYHELAYLYPNRFTPDKNILQEIGVDLKEPYFVVRFNAFKAHHDTGSDGLSFENKQQLIEILKARGKVFITTERELEKEFKPYQLILSSEKVHSLIYYATMFLGDSQTMTTESALLGTPALKCNAFAGKLSVPNELERKYKLCYSFQPDDFDKFLSKIIELLETPKLEEIWQQRRKTMLADKIDVTSFIVWFIENYPKSVEIMRKNPGYQYVFK